MSSHDTQDQQLVSSGNIVVARPMPKPLTWRRRLLIHLGASAALFGVGMLGFWINAPHWNLQAATATSGVITAWLNIVIAITLSRR